MRVELRVEHDEHELAVAVEGDQGVSVEHAILVTTTAMAELMNEPFKLPHSG